MGEPVKICVIGEWLHGLPDEGIHNLAQNLIRQWEKGNSVSMVRLGKDIQVNRFFFSLELRKKLRTLKPDVVFYISPSCAEIGALYRARLIKIYSPQAKVFVVATQPAEYGRPEKWLLPLLVPDGIFVQSAHGKEVLKGVRCPIHFMPSGVDLERFVPVEPERKKELRRQYGLDEEALLVLHVGHIKPDRNVGILASVSHMKGVQAVLVGSASTTQDEALVDQLKQARVHVVREFIPCIEEFYQLADVYLFPVISDQSAIGVPLSVLEAMACNLPVITTRFEGLPLMFEEGQGLIYFNKAEELPGLMADAKALSNCSTREKVSRYSWDEIASQTIKNILEENQVWN